MKKVGMVALSVLLAISGMQVSADPMAERQAQLEKEREAYMQGLERQNNAATLGWHWYQDPAEQEVDEAAPDEEAPAQPTPAPNEEMVQIDVKWLRENLPKMLDDAMNNPGDMQKVKLYWLAQKMAVDMATKFQDETRRMYIANPQLNEDSRRPETQFQLTTHNEQVKAGKAAAVQKVFDKAGLWFFYSSTCQYCIKEGPILNFLERLYNVNILAVSMDGLPLPGSEFADVVVDEGGVMAAKLSVEKTPSMFLVSNDGSKIHKVSEGLVPMDELLETILYVARGAGFITEQELQDSRDVRQFLMTDEASISPSGELVRAEGSQPGENASSLIEVSKSDLERSPDALIAQFETRLNYPSYTTQQVNSAQPQGVEQ
ncbi:MULTISPECIES: conjugal transfer protein TraF [Aeromonas]|uniref:Conjugal transfer protein TraF n=1 Tax=Aeromonas allosaccharophila TaxID=656 RepID=A0AAX3P1A4_9GAMM|nr:conjugal transfer protein TraF [Aeromonas allosaccharophila]WED79110.1 conjugal transfer protein TraF [Aeromonas allosaccharophila]